MTAYYSAFQIILDRAPDKPPQDCAHDWRIIIGNDYERQIAEVAMCCPRCHAVRLPSFREMLLHYKIPPLPQGDDGAEAIAFGSALRRLESAFDKPAMKEETA